ncbi:hypothetical protein MTR_6g065930 [Medicago truncatula]|uniref:Uncharacterized protein n=1 Tax=Medicago truncatula TaxID=3880 RepID=A0A072ULC5_MEDTR|nr:hypothetical protein MTR_6g065930 [Medicago truncatula]
MRPNQNFYKTPQNPFGQTAPPGYANNQGVPQKSSLELLMENYVINQSKQLQENDSFVKLTSKVDSISTHNKMLETQISQIAQQVATSSQTSEIFPGQTKANPKGLINAITLRDGKLLQDTVVKTKTIEGKIKSEKPQSEKAIGDSDKPIVSPPHKPKIPFTQRIAMPNLRGPGSFSIPCVIESETIEEAMCDLGASVSLMRLFFVKDLVQEDHGDDSGDEDEVGENLHDDSVHHDHEAGGE